MDLMKIDRLKGNYDQDAMRPVIIVSLYDIDVTTNEIRSRHVIEITCIIMAIDAV